MEAPDSLRLETEEKRRYRVPSRQYRCRLRSSISLTPGWGGVDFQVMAAHDADVGGIGESDAEAVGKGGGVAGVPEGLVFADPKLVKRIEREREEGIDGDVEAVPAEGVTAAQGFELQGEAKGHALLVAGPEIVLAVVGEAAAGVSVSAVSPAMDGGQQ